MLPVPELPVCGLWRLLALLLLLPLAREGGQGQGRDTRATARGPQGALASHSVVNRSPLQTYVVVGDQLIKSPRGTHGVGSEHFNTSPQGTYNVLQDTLVRSRRGSYSDAGDDFKRSPRGTYSVVGDQWGRSEGEEGQRTGGSTGGGLARLAKIPTQQFGKKHIVHASARQEDCGNHQRANVVLTLVSAYPLDCS